MHINGKTLKDALENGVSHYPKYEGRFPFISGFKFKFDPSQPPYSRIKMEDIETEEGPINPERIYKVALKGFISEAKDGYECFRDGIIDFILDSKSAQKIHDIIFNCFSDFRIDIP